MFYCTTDILEIFSMQQNEWFPNLTSSDHHMEQLSDIKLLSVNQGMALIFKTASKGY